MRIGPGPEQPVDEHRVVVAGRPVQRRRAVGRSPVRIGASGEQRNRLRLFGGPGRLHQPQVLRRDVCGEGRENTDYEQHVTHGSEF
jgi:hypothetical protein